MLPFFLDLPDSKLYHFNHNKKICNTLACGLRLGRAFRLRDMSASSCRVALGLETRRGPPVTLEKTSLPDEIVGS